MNINAPDPASLLLAQLPTRPLPAASGAPVQPTTLPVVPNAPVVIPASATAPIVSVDPLAALLQTATGDQPEIPLPTADLARRYAESGTLSQMTARNVVQPQAQPQALGAADAKLLSGLAQAYRQDATATPLPQPANVARELANAVLPNAPGSAGNATASAANAPAVIVVDGRSFPLNPAQASVIRDALGTAKGLDPRVLTDVVRATVDAAAIARPQPPSALRELITAQIPQPANVPAQPQASAAATGTVPLPQATLPVVRDAPLLPQLPQAPPQVVARDGTLPAPLPGNAAQPLATGAAILIDGRTIALSPAQVAIVRANLGPLIKIAGPSVGTDSENPLVVPTVQRVASAQSSERVPVIDASARLAVESSERHTRPQPQDIGNMVSQMQGNEKVEAIRAIRAEHVTPYEPQLITTPQPQQNQVVLAPAPDRVILAGHAPSEVADVSAIASIVIGVAPGITRDDVTAEIHQGGYRISFTGSTDAVMLHAGAGLSAQLVFADGTSMRLQLSQD